MTQSVVEFIRESERPRFDDPPRVTGDCLIISDLELPFHHAEFVNNCFCLAHAYGIRQLVLAGDFLHWESFSFWAQEERDSDEEIAEIQGYLAPLLANFDKILWIAGNHDTRIQRALGRKLSQEFASRLIVPFSLADRWQEVVKVSDYYYAALGNDWLIEHPAVKGAQIPARTAVWIAEAEGKNVCQGHTHLWGVAQTRDGRHVGIDMGVGVDVKRLHYQSVRHSTHPRGVNGALIMRCGAGGRYYPQLLSPLLTDWTYEHKRAADYRGIESGANEIREAEQGRADAERDSGQEWDW